MNFEEYKEKRKELKDREETIDSLISDLSKEKHEIHTKLRSMCKEYVVNSKEFPFKEGEKYEYTDKIEIGQSGLFGEIKEIVTLEEINCYNALISEITLYFTTSNGQKLRFDFVNLQGVIRFSPNAKFKKID